MFLLCMHRWFGWFSKLKNIIICSQDIVRTDKEFYKYENVIDFQVIFWSLIENIKLILQCLQFCNIAALSMRERDDNRRQHLDGLVFWITSTSSQVHYVDAFEDLLIKAKETFFPDRNNSFTPLPFIRQIFLSQVQLSLQCWIVNIPIRCVFIYLYKYVVHLCTPINPL